MKTAVLFGEVLGQVVVGHRRARKRNQTDIAKALRVTQSSLSRLERGRASFNVIQLRQTARALGTEASSLVREAEEVTAALSKKGVSVLDEEPAEDERAGLIWVAPREVEATVATVKQQLRVASGYGWPHEAGRKKVQAKAHVHTGRT